MNVIWTREALEKLTEIEEFIARDSPQRAETFINYLIERGNSISQSPQMGRIVPEILNPVIREIIVRKCRIVFRIQKETIEILTVFEGHRLLRLGDVGFE